MLTVNQFELKMTQKGVIGCYLKPISTKGCRQTNYEIVTAGSEYDNDRAV